MLTVIQTKSKLEIVKFKGDMLSHFWREPLHRQVHVRRFSE